MRIAIVFIIFTTVFSLIGYYIYARLAQAFVGAFVSSVPFIIFYIFVLSSFIVGKTIEQFSIGVISDILIKIGSVGAAIFVYALLFIILFDIIRLINYIFPFYPEFISSNYQKVKLIVGISSLVLISIIFILGYINALKPNIKEIEISVNKPNADFKELNIVAVSDIHLGTIVNKSKTENLIKTINNLNPDIVLIAGDIIDDNINVVKHYKLLEFFKKLNPKYDVYSCLGNHEYISKAHTELDYFEKNGIHMLKDTTVKIYNKFYLIGRDDIQGERMTGKKRKTLSELTKDIDSDLPVILLDHQPFKLDETAEHNIDFQFSGHTHSGQIWPFNYITGLLFEEDWGYLKKKNTHFYISSGFGTAVVPIRVGNNSEIVDIRLLNKKQVHFF